MQVAVRRRKRCLDRYFLVDSKRPEPLMNGKAVDGWGTGSRLMWVLPSTESLT